MLTKSSIFLVRRYAVELTASEAKARLPELLRAVEAGERVIITRYGKAVAQLSGMQPDAASAFEEIRSLRKGQRLGQSISDALAEVRR
jgi:prevent-host-death family protein